MRFPSALHIHRYSLSLGLSAILLAIVCSAQAWALDPRQMNTRGVELIQQGRYEEALDLLKQAYRALPGNGVVRRNLAAGYLGLGTKQIEARQFDAAAETLLTGREYGGDDARFWLYRGLALYHLGRYQEAEDELNEARGRDERPETLRLLGQVYYSSGRLEQAIQVWRQALDRGGYDAELAALVDKTWKELKVEQTMSSEAGSNFAISFDGRAQPELGDEVLDVLEEAYNEIGRELDFYPQVQVPVLLYTQRDFSELTGSPDWSGGLYDGKIRIPVGGVTGMNPRLKAVLYHEYVHVVVRYLTAGRCPVWLNEGLAEMAGRRHHDPPLNRLRLAAARGELIPFERLESSFPVSSREQAELAYQQSYSLVRYMIDQFHWYKMGELLRALGEGKPIAVALEQALGEFAIDYAGLQSGWRREAAVR